MIMPAMEHYGLQACLLGLLPTSTWEEKEPPTEQHHDLHERMLLTYLQSMHLFSLRAGRVLPAQSYLLDSL